MAQELKIWMLVQYIEPDYTWGYITIEKIDGDYVEGDGYRVHKAYCTPASKNNNQSNRTIMAQNSRQGAPEGTKWKVNLTRNRDGGTMYMIVYGPRKEQAIASVKDSVRGTGWTVAGAEKAE